MHPRWRLLPAADGRIVVTPDRKYRTAVRRLHVLCWLVSVVLLVAAVVTVGPWPVAGILFGFSSLGAMRLAAEVRDEMDRWGRPDRTAARVAMYAGLAGNETLGPLVRHDSRPWSTLTAAEQADELREACGRGLLDVPDGVTWQ